MTTIIESATEQRFHDNLRIWIEMLESKFGSRRKLAHKADINPESIRKWVTKSSWPSVESLMKLARINGQSLSEVIELLESGTQPDRPAIPLEVLLEEVANRSLNERLEIIAVAANTKNQGASMEELQRLIRVKLQEISIQELSRLARIPAEIINQILDTGTLPCEEDPEYIWGALAFYLTNPTTGIRFSDAESLAAYCGINIEDSPRNHHINGHNFKGV